MIYPPHTSCLGARGVVPQRLQVDSVGSARNSPGPSQVPFWLGRRMWAMKSSCRRVFVLAVLLCALPWLSARGDSGSTPTTSTATTSIPGPLRSFLRMAGISQKASPEEVLPLLSREVAVKGYQTLTEKSGKAVAGGRSTEYLLLLQNYLKQARDLEALAGSSGVIRISTCGDAQSLLAILGYSLPQTCGPNVALQTLRPG